MHKTVNQGKVRDSTSKAKYKDYKSIESPSSRKVTSMLRKSWDSQHQKQENLDDNLQTFRRSYKKGHVSMMKKGANGNNADLDDVIEKQPAKLRSSQ